MTFLTGLMIFVGLVGVVVPVLPGLLLVWAGVAVWGLARHDTAGWVALAVATVLVAAGTAAKYLLPGRRLRAAGVPWTTIAAGTVLGIVGFFVIPVVGLFVGFVLGVYLAEWLRLAEPAGAAAIGGPGAASAAEAPPGITGRAPAGDGGRRSAAWASTRHALAAVGWSILIELTTGLLVAATWVGIAVAA